jgi:hypothetical protein
MVKVNEGLKLLFQLCPGMAAVFSYKSMEVQEKRHKAQGTRYR